MADILQSAPQVTILVTSRERLHLQEEQVFGLGGLDVPQAEQTEDVEGFTAVQLFLQSAHRVKHDFQLHQGDQRWLTRICHLVAGMPLALELAAGWVEMLSLADIAQEIQQSLDFLETDLHNIPARHRSIHAVFASSWRRMERAEKDVFSKLSIFRGGFTRRAAQAITEVSLHTLSKLVSKSLLQYSRSRDRYFVHELLRQYAAEKLKESGEETAVRERHSDFYCALLHQHTPNWHNAHQVEALTEVIHEADNIQVAWRWALAHEAWHRLNGAIDSWGWYHQWRGLHTDGELFCQVICGNLEQWAATQLADTSIGYRLWARAMAWYGAFAVDSRVGLQRLQQSQTLLARPELATEDTRWEQAFACLEMAEKLTVVNRQEAQIFAEKSLSLYKALQVKWGVARALRDLVFLDWGTGNYALARERIQKCLSIQQGLEDRWNQIGSLDALAYIHQHMGQFAEAEKVCYQILELCQQLDDRSYLVGCMAHLAAVVLWQGRFDESQAWAEKSLAYYLEYGNQNSEGFVNLHIGMPLLFAGQYEQAQQRGRQALASVKVVNNHGVEASVHWLLGCLALVNQVYEEAEASFAESLRLYREVQDNYICLGLMGIAYTACCRGDWQTAHHYLLEVLAHALKMQDFLQLMIVLPGGAFYLVRRGAVEQGIVIWSQAQCHPFIANSQWYGDVVGQAVREATANLPPHIIEVARANGRSQDIWQTAEFLLTELTELGWGEDAD